MNISFPLIKIKRLYKFSNKKNRYIRFTLHLCTKLGTKTFFIGSGNYEFKYEIIMISLRPTKRRQ